MKWTVHGERLLYESPWVELELVDVELPDGQRFEHHVVRMPNKAAGAVVHDRDRGVLLLWRHRFITDAWGWEIPAGRIDPGEEPGAALKLRVADRAATGTVQLDGEVLRQGAVKAALVSGMTVLDAHEGANPVPLTQENGTHSAILQGPAAFSIAPNVTSRGTATTSSFSYG